MNGFTAELAETIISSMFSRTKTPTKYIAGFRTAKGREMALQRNRQNSVSLWAECIDRSIHHNLTYKYYDKTKSRSSNLTANAGKLAIGNEAWYITFDDDASLSSFLQWYKDK